MHTIHIPCALWVLLTAATVTLATGKPNEKISAYMTPFAFCERLPPGDYCNPAFPRTFHTCPSALSRYCPPHTICSVGKQLGTVQCVPNLWDPVGKLCFGKPDGTSFCHQNMTVECSSGETFQCPSDMTCKRRGRRAYCVEPQFLQQEPTTGLCQGLGTRKATICHPTNLKKIIRCPTEQVSFCGIGHMCGLPRRAVLASSSSAAAGAGEVVVEEEVPTEAQCVPYERDPVRFCSNKPLFSSRCLPGTNGTMLLCSQQPQLLNCPTGKCVQEYSITARCIHH